jgi:branched-chain amino acid transport system ATP-binding protein
MNWDITIENVAMHYGGVKAVDGVSLAVPGGALAGLMGPNGAGKSTLFNVITRVIDPTCGTVKLGENDCTGMSIGAFAKLPVGRTFQTPRCFLSLTVLENITCMLPDPRDTLVGALFRRSNRETTTAAKALLDRVGLSRHMNDKASTLSGGERRMLEVGRQLARQPRVLLLDEPTAGLDGAHQATLRELLISLAGEGVTIFLVEHNVGFMMSTATQIHVMAHGRLIMEGAPEAVAKSPEVAEAYFGKAEHGAVA